MIRINVLPDNVLLEIFDFYVKNRSLRITKRRVEIWHPLVHVCRRWRSLVFESSHRLDLQLCCTPKTPSRDTLDVWPALPLIIKGDMASSDADNIVVALGHSNRVCEVNLWKIGRRQLEEVLATMHVPYPEIIELGLKSHDDETLPVPDSFLGGSAPRLKLIQFEGIAFPGLPKLLLSATHLVRLDLFNTPHSGYFSPETMVALLSALSGLKRLSLGFKSPQSCPDWKIRRPPPLKRSVIPSLARFFFRGVSEYLEDLVTCIDVPQLDELKIGFFNQIDFDTPRLARFISRTPTFSTRAEARVQFGDSAIEVKLTYQTHKPGDALSRIKILCGEPDWQLSSIAQVCNSSLPPLYMVEDLYIKDQYHFLRVWENDAIENTLWLELLLPFTAVKNLYISKKFAPGIAAALQELVEDRIMEVLPSLRKIFVQELQLSEPPWKHIEQFVDARQLSGHPVLKFRI